MKLNNILMFLLLVSAVFAGCSDEQFLQENPKCDYTVDNIFSTSTQADQAITTCYAFFREMMTLNKGENSTGYVFRGNGTDMYDTPSNRMGQLFNDYSLLTPDTPEFKKIFSNWYSLILKANLAIHAAELDGVVWPSSEAKAYLMAQAKFFRAWAYKSLAEEFGGVPIVTGFETVPRYDYVRETREGTYKYAIDELESILNDLPETTPDHGRIVRGAAQHALCELYVALGTTLQNKGMSSDAKAAYEKAIKYGDDVIDGGTYSLMKDRFGTRAGQSPVFYWSQTETGKTAATKYSAAGVDVEGNVYWDLFQEGNQDYQDGNKESIWTIQINYDARTTIDTESRLPYPRVFGPVMRKRNENFLGTMEDVGGRGVCYVMPTFYTRDLIYDGKWADDMRNSEAVFRRMIIGNVSGKPYYGKVVPWDEIYRFDWESQADREYSQTQAFPISCKITSDIFTDDAIGGDKSYIYRDDYVIRLSETILLRAEAKMRSGDNAGAASDINKLRERAKCGYMVTPADVSLDLILDERARELVYEEIRWNTLLRMEGTVAIDRIKKYAYWDNIRQGKVKDVNLWPIPQSVIDTNKDCPMEQNPGW